MRVCFKSKWETRKNHFTYQAEAPLWLMVCLPMWIAQRQVIYNNEYIYNVPFEERTGTNLKEETKVTSA